MNIFWKKYGVYIPVVLAFLVNINTLFNDYALDDAIVITQNEFTKQGISGIKDILTHDTFTGFFGKQKKLVEGGRYRPLSLVTFAIEYEFFNKNAFISHFINLILYILSVYLLFKIFRGVFPDEYNNFSIIAMVTLFALHPLHTEVVANIKGRDEILALLFSLVTIQVLLNNRNKFISVGIAAASYFLALMSKEIAVVFLFIIPLAQYLLLRHSVKKIFQVVCVLLVPLAFFLIIRSNVLGETKAIAQELMNNPFLEATSSQKYATIAVVFLIYIKLLIFPHPLTFDYYPYHIPLYDWSNLIPYAGIFVYLVIIIRTFGMYRKQKNIIVLGVLIFLIPLLLISNIFFPIGTFLNERFLYVSSIGYAIVFFVALKSLAQRFKLDKYLPIIIATILLLYAGKTISRNIIWKNDYTLFTTDVQVSKNSAKANTTAGGALLEKAQAEEDSIQKSYLLEKSVFHLRRALDIHPLYRDPKLLLGNAYWEKGKMIDSVIYYYTDILKKEPGYDIIYTNVNFMSDKLKKPLQKIHLLESVYPYNPGNFDINYKLGNIYGKELGNINKAIQYLESAYKINPKNTSVLTDLGVANGIAGNFDMAVRFLAQAIRLSPNDASLYHNLGIVYYQSGNREKAETYFAKANELKSGKQN